MTYIGLLTGAVFGSLLAWRRKGILLDILQYMAVCSIVGGLLALILNVFILRWV